MPTSTQDILLTIAAAVFALALLFFFASVRQFRRSRKDVFWRRRREAGQRGWRFFLVSFVMFGLGTLSCAASFGVMWFDLAEGDDSTTTTAVVSSDGAMTPSVAVEPTAPVGGDALVTPDPGTVSEDNPAPNNVSDTPAENPDGLASTVPPAEEEDSASASQTPAVSAIAPSSGVTETMVTPTPTVALPTASDVALVPTESLTTEAPSPALPPTTMRTPMASRILPPSQIPVTPDEGADDVPERTPDRTPDQFSPTPVIVTVTPGSTPSVTPFPTFTPQFAATPLVASVTPRSDALMTISALDSQLQQADTDNYTPVEPRTTFDTQTERIFVFVDFRNMTDGVWWRYEVADQETGKLLADRDDVWALGDEGDMYFFFDSSDLAPGEYEIRLYVGADSTIPRNRESFTVVDAPAEE
ncbi:MAG: hypothetical protein GYB65_22420 [Chloroflexi bacterium]|nr:hypothetical protein [Chloroflexota bacterium]